VALSPGDNPLEGFEGELWDIEAVIDPGSAREVGLTLRGEAVVSHVTEQTLTCLGKEAPLATEDGTVHIRALLDRTSLEVFGNHGAVAMAACFLPDEGNTALGAYAVGGEARIVSLQATRLKSAWD